MHKVLDVGNCGPDYNAIKRTLGSKYDVQLYQAHGPDDCLKLMREHEFALVMINRKLDQDYSDGIEILKQIKTDAALSSVPVMLITNYEEHQQASIAAGGIRGFGKLELDKPETHERLSAVLS